MQATFGLLSFRALIIGGVIIIGTKGQQREQQEHDINPGMSPGTGVPLSMGPAPFAAGFSEKRGTAEEPSCEELRAMWRYSKRQNRAAEITNEIPTYRDPFSYNVWEPYLDRAQSSMVYRGSTGPARVRGAGGAPIYGRVIHKAPASHRLRNGMPDRTRMAFGEVARQYGTVNRHPAQTPRHRPSSFRHGGGASPSSSDPMALVPQAGSFQHLKELIRTERARELQEQRIAEEVAARATVLQEMTNGRQDSRQHYLNSLQPYNEMKNVNYNDYDQVQYVSNVGNLGQSISRGGEQYGRGGYALR